MEPGDPCWIYLPAYGGVAIALNRAEPVPAATGCGVGVLREVRGRAAAVIARFLRRI